MARCDARGGGARHTFGLYFLALVEGEVWGQEFWTVGVGHLGYCEAEEEMRVGDEGGDSVRAVALIGFTKRCEFGGSRAVGVGETKPGKGKVARSVNSAPPPGLS